MPSSNPPPPDVEPSPGPEPTAPGKSLASNVAMLFGSQTVTWLISLSTIIIVPRVLGPTAIGQITLVAAVWAMAGMFTNAGTGTVVTLSVARDRSRGPEVIGPVVVARLLLFVVVALVVALFVALTGPGTDVAVLYAVFGAAAVFATVGNVAGTALQGFEDMGAVARANITVRFVEMVIVLGTLLVFGLGVRAVAAAAALAALLEAVLLFRSLRRYARTRLAFDVSASAQVLRRGLPYFAGGVLLTVYHQIDVVVMSLLVDDEQIGWYAAADRLFGTALFIPTIVMTAVFPVLARKHTEDATAATEMLAGAFRTLLLFAIPIGFGMVAMGRPIAEMLFGDEFSEAGPVLGVIGIVLMLTFQTILVGQYAVATGRERFFFTLLFIAILATIPLDLVLVPLTDRLYGNGAIGGALAYVVTESFILVVAVWKLAPEIISRTTAVRFVKCSVAGGVMMAVVWPTRGFFPIVGVGIGASVYVALLLASRPFDEREIDAFGRMRRKLAARLRGGTPRV